MNISDRGIIKWQPFNSCFNAQLVIKDIKKVKNRKTYPNLSEDQLENIEEKIKEAYNLKLFVQIKYYYDGIINVIEGQINGISPNDQKLYLNNKIIYFKQILNVKEL